MHTMLTLVYVFSFLTWGLFLLIGSALFFQRLSLNEIKIQRQQLELDQYTSFFGSVSKSVEGRPSLSALQEQQSEIPEKIKKLMETAQGHHPEVLEIDGTDVILGVKFEAENYPPGFGEDIE